MHVDMGEQPESIGASESSDEITKGQGMKTITLAFQRSRTFSIGE